MKAKAVQNNKTKPAEKQTRVTKRAIASWAMFDWAAQPFFTVVTTFVFGPYFVSVVAENNVIGQAQWGFAAAFAGFVIAIFSPILGSVSDASGSRKPWIISFAFVKIISLFMLWFALPHDQSNLYLILFFFSLATIAAEFSIVFNDSMLPNLSNHKNIGQISNFAWGLGYLGGMVMLVLILGFFAASPETGKTILGFTPLFGLDPFAHEGDRISGPLSAIWYLVFLLPMLFFTPDFGTRRPLKAAIKVGLADILKTLKAVKNKKGLRNFYIARMIYQDGVNGILVLGSPYAAGLFGWQIIEIGIYGIILNLAAILSCAIAGLLDRLLGSRTIIFICLSLLIIATLGIVSTDVDSSFFVMALSSEDSGGLFGTMAEKIYIAFGLLVGIAFGPIQASSRSFLGRSIPSHEAGSYFGLYALVGRATSFIALLMVASVTAIFYNAKIGMASLILFFVIGFIILMFAPSPTAQNEE